MLGKLLTQCSPIPQFHICKFKSRWNRLTDQAVSRRSIQKPRSFPEERRSKFVP